jgi:hypothetical protein
METASAGAVKEIPSDAATYLKIMGQHFLDCLGGKLSLQTLRFRSS